MSGIGPLLVRDLSAIQGWVLSLVRRAESLDDPIVLQKRCAFARGLVVRAGQYGSDLEQTLDKLADRKIDLPSARALLRSVTVPSVSLPFGALWQEAAHPIGSQLRQDPMLLARCLVEPIDQLMLGEVIRIFGKTPVSTVRLTDHRPAHPRCILEEARSFRTVSSQLARDMEASGWHVFHADSRNFDIGRGEQILSVSLDFPRRANAANKSDILGAFQGSPLLAGLKRRPDRVSPRSVSLYFDGDLADHRRKEDPDFYASPIDEYLFFRWDPGIANINLFGNVNLGALIAGLDEAYRDKLRAAQYFLKNYSPKSGQGVAVNMFLPKEAEWRRFFINATSIALNVYVDGRTDLSPGELHHLFHRVGPRFLGVMTERFLDALPPWAVYNFGIPV